VHKWKTEWIEVAEDLVRDEYKNNYEGKKEYSDAESTKCDKPIVRDSSCQLCAIVIDGHGMQIPFDSDFSNFVNYSVNEKSTADDSELDSYLKLPVESVEDPLKWWNDHRKIYPNLSRMVLDYLSIPGMSFCLLASETMELTLSFQPPLQLSSASSHKADSFSTSHEMPFLHSPFVLRSALAHGAKMI